MMFSRKPFPATVNWRMLWKHRWSVLNFLNQVAYGSQADAIYVVAHYGGCYDAGVDLYSAARAIINTHRTKGE